MATRAAREPAPVAPVGRVCVDVPLPHLDRPFDYLVPADLDAAARPGVRVRIRFAGQLVDGYLLSRVDASEHPGRLAFLERVVSAEPVLSAEILDLARAVAQRYAGMLADVLRLAVPGHRGRGAVVALADGRGLDGLEAAMRVARGEGQHVALSAALGPAERYRRFLAAARGHVGVVVGTRAAAFAPVAKLGLVAMWDDGDDLYAEPRAPYPHAREVLLTRAQLSGAGALLGGYARSVEAQQLIATGWAKELVAPRETVRGRAPAVVPTAHHSPDPTPA